MLSSLLRVFLFIMALKFFKAARIAAEDDAREKDVIPLCLIGTIFGIGFIAELCINNPNSGLYFKVSLALLFWVMAVLQGSKFENATLIVLSIITAISFIYGITYAFEDEHVDRELVQKIYLVAANDTYEIQGEGTFSRLGGTFSISENGVYRYYYIAGNGLKVQGKVPAENTYIDDTLTDGQPYLVTFRSYDEYYFTRNRERSPQGIHNEYVWHELHVPAGSIVESYKFDLR